MFKVIYDGEIELKDHKTVFAETLESLAKEDPRIIYLDADLMNSIGTYKFWQEYPQVAINVGVAEANMMGIAGGLSAVGRIPYVHTFGPFASRRSYDQIFLSIGYAGNSVRIFGSDPGVTAAFNGGTHMPFEDMALMRAIPGAGVFDPADGVQLAWLLKALKDRKGVSYFRSPRKATKKIYEEGSAFTLGKGNIIREGKDLTIIACGIMVGEALRAAELLEQDGISARVVDMFTVKPLDEELVYKCAEETGAIVTAENHNVIGGLGDAVASALAQGTYAPLIKHGVQDRFGQVGPDDFLMKEYSLTAEDLVSSCNKIFERKKSN